MNTPAVKHTALQCFLLGLAPSLACVLMLCVQPDEALRGEPWKINGVLFYSLLFFPIATTLAPWNIVASQSSPARRCLASLAAALTTALIATLGLVLLVRPRMSHSMAFLELSAVFCAASAALFHLLRNARLNHAFAYAVTATLGLLALGNVFYLNSYIEKLGEAGGRSQFIHSMLSWNPFAALAYGGLDGLQWLHSPLMYQLSIIGPYYGFKYPSLHGCAARYTAVTVITLGLSMLLLRFTGRQAPPSDAHR